MDVGPSAFDEASSGAAIAGFGDAIAVDVVAGRSFGGREAEVSHELAWVLKAPRIADLDQERRGGDEADATHGLEGFDQRCHGPVGNFELDRMLQALDALIGIAHGVDALLEDDLVSWMLERLSGEPISVPSSPSSLSWEDAAVSEEE